MIVEAAPAKLNLTLRVTGRRPDGYHELDSLVAFASLGDSLAATAADELSLALDGPFADALPPGPDNLVLRAAGLLRGRLGIRGGARLGLTKRLPVASGIGGGSADAAATLRALLRLWRADLPERELASIALTLGADLPVCLAGRPARMQGIGERLTSLDGLAEAALLLVNPGIPLATAAVFRAREGGFSPPFDPGPGPHDPAALVRAGGNDLLAPARLICPAIDAVLAALAAQARCRAAALSGSGATCFALFPDTASAVAAGAGIAAAEPAWWIAQTRLAAP